MPLNKTSGNRGWKYGKNGKAFNGKDGKKKALMDGLAKIAAMPDTFPVDIGVEITKSDSDKQYVFGWANVSMANGELVVDSHGDTISIEELENAAYNFTLSYNAEAVGEMHKGEAQGRLIESVMITPEKLTAMKLSSEDGISGWWVGMHVEDAELFAKVKDGTYRAISIQGLAQRVKGD